MKTINLSWLTQNKSLKNIFLILISLFTSLFLVLFFAETLFFDKFYYQKSASFGYDKNERNLINQTQISSQLRSRIKDLNDLLEIRNQNQSKILGTSSEGNKNIAIIGDSIAYGLGVKNDQKFGNYLEKLFHKNDIKVFTLAQAGDSLLDHYAKMKIAKETINPDIYVVTLVANDLLFDSKDKYPQTQQIFDQLKTKCKSHEFIYEWTNLPPQRWHEVITIGIANSYNDQYANTCYAKEILTMINSEFKNVIFLPVDEYIPSNELHQNNPDFVIIMSQAMEKLIQITKDSGGTVLNPKGILSDFKFQPVSKSESHPSKYTHQQFANILYLYINNHLWSKFSNN